MLFWVLEGIFLLGFFWEGWVLFVCLFLSFEVHTPPPPFAGLVLFLYFFFFFVVLVFFWLIGWLVG